MAVSNFFAAVLLTILLSFLLLDFTNGQRQFRTRERNDVRTNTVGSGPRRPGSTRSTRRQRIRGGLPDRIGERGRNQDLDIFKSCPASSPRIQCDPTLCSQATCERFPEARCVIDPCGDCHVDWFVGRRMVNCKEGPPLECPQNIVPRRRCTSCRNAFCELHPEAECRVDSCGKCKAAFFVNSQRVNCRPPLNLIDPCPNLSDKRWVCPKEMCRFTVCPNNHRVYCNVDNCGGCHALYRFKWTKDAAICTGYWSQYEIDAAKRGYEYNGTLPKIVYDNPHDTPITQANDPRRTQHSESQPAHDHSHPETGHPSIPSSPTSHDPHDHQPPKTVQSSSGTPTRDRQRPSPPRVSLDPHDHQAAATGQPRRENLGRGLPDLASRRNRQRPSPTQTAPDPHDHPTSATGQPSRDTHGRGLPDLASRRDRQRPPPTQTAPDPHDHPTSATEQPSRDTHGRGLPDLGSRRDRQRPSLPQTVPDQHDPLAPAAAQPSMETFGRGLPDLSSRRDRQRPLPPLTVQDPHDHQTPRTEQPITKTTGRRLPAFPSRRNRQRPSPPRTIQDPHDHATPTSHQPNRETTGRGLPELASRRDQQHPSPPLTVQDPHDHQTPGTGQPSTETTGRQLPALPSRRIRQRPSPPRTIQDPHDHATPTSHQPSKETTGRGLPDLTSRRDRQRPSPPGTIADPHDHPTPAAGQQSIETFGQGLPDLGSGRERQRPSLPQTVPEQHDRPTPAAAQLSRQTTGRGLPDLPSTRNRQRPSPPSTVPDQHNQPTSATRQPSMETFGRGLPDLGSRRDRQRPLPPSTVPDQHDHVPKETGQPRRNIPEVNSGPGSQSLPPKHTAQEPHDRQRPDHLHSNREMSASRRAPTKPSPSLIAQTEVRRDRQHVETLPTRDNTGRRIGPSRPVSTSNERVLQSGSNTDRPSRRRTLGRTSSRPQQSSSSSSANSAGSSSSGTGQQVSSGDSRMQLQSADPTQGDTPTSTSSRRLSSRRRPSLPSFPPSGGETRARPQRPSFTRSELDAALGTRSLSIERNQQRNRQESAQSITDWPRGRPPVPSDVSATDTTRSANENRLPMERPSIELISSSFASSSPDTTRRQPGRRRSDRLRSREERLSRLLQGGTNSEPRSPRENQPALTTSFGTSQAGDIPFGAPPASHASRSARSSLPSESLPVWQRPHSQLLDNSKLDMQLGMNFANTLNKNPVPVTLFDISSMLGESSGVPILQR